MMQRPTLASSTLMEIATLSALAAALNMITTTKTKSMFVTVNVAVQLRSHFKLSQAAITTHCSDV